MHPISSRGENDSQSSTEEVSQLFTSTSRGAFPQKYPLPDFSKVGPRVKFPKDESYRPPKARSHSRLPEGPAKPLIFKSPAEIVREVLLSSGDVCPGKNPPPTHPITRVPQEFQTPEQATKLVHQLQVSLTHVHPEVPARVGWRLDRMGGSGGSGGPIQEPPDRDGSVVSAAMKILPSPFKKKTVIALML